MNSTHFVPRSDASSIPIPATADPQSQGADQAPDPRVNAGEHRPTAEPAVLAGRQLSASAPQLGRLQPSGNLRQVPAAVIQTGVLPFLEYNDQQALSRASKHLRTVADAKPAQDKQVADQFGEFVRLEEKHFWHSIRAWDELYLHDLQQLMDVIARIELDPAVCLAHDFEDVMFDLARPMATSADYDLARTAFTSGDPKKLVEALTAISARWPQSPEEAQARANAFQQEFETSKKTLIEGAPAIMLAREKRGFRTPDAICWFLKRPSRKFEIRASIQWTGNEHSTARSGSQAAVSSRT